MILPMSKAKKAKRGDLVTMYVRVKPEVHAQIIKIAGERGYPHNMSSVASEMISQGLASESTRAHRGEPPNIPPENVRGDFSPENRP